MTKKNAIKIISLGTVLLLLLSLAITAICYFAINSQHKQNELALSNRARNILLKNFTPMELGSKGEKKRIIDNKNPMNLLNYYGNEDLLLLWSSIPKNQKPYTIMLLIPGHCLLPGQDKAIDFLENNADICEANSIPYAIQNINGEYHSEERLPIAYLEERFAKHKYFYGLNGAELYNGVDWRGDMESDQSLYLMDCIKLCAKYGAFFIWTDTNRGYESGMLLQWLENNESFYTTFKNYSEYICLLNKESFGNPSTYAIMQGLWLAGLVGNWGVASDWWHWQVDGDKQSLFGEFDDYVDNEWDQILSFPENMYVQSMMLVMSRGGTCFKAEAPNFSTSVGGVAVGGFEYGISPLLDRIISRELNISDKQTVLNETKTIILGGENWIEYNYDYVESNLYPKTGVAGIIPLLPINLRFDERAVFLNQGIKIYDTKMSVEDFKSIYGEDKYSNSYITSCGNSWYYIQNVENVRSEKYANFAPRISSASNIEIISAEHTSAIITESNKSLNFYISNYRTDKSAMVKELTEDLRNKIGSWVDICGKYMVIDKNGDPIGVDDSALRKVKIVIAGSLNGGKPIVNLKSNIDGSGKNGRAFSYEEIWNSEKNELTINIMQNGVVEFDVLLDDSGKELVFVTRNAIAETVIKNDNSTESLNKLIEETIIDKHNYTYYSYLNYNRALGYAQKLVYEKNGSSSDILNAEKELIKAKSLLIDINKQIELFSVSFLLIDDTAKGVKIGSAFDRLLREILSVKKYVEGRTSKLGYAKLYKNGKINNELGKKNNYINKHFNYLNKLIYNN